MLSAKEAVELSGLARHLVLENIIDEPSAHRANDKSSREKVPFVTHLVENTNASSQDIAMSAANEFGEPLLDLDAYDFDALPRNLVSERLIRRHHALPLFKRGTRLYVAVSDPTNLLALDEFKFHTGLNTEAILVEENKLTDVIERFLEDQAQTLEDIDDAELEGLEIDTSDDRGHDDGDVKVVDDAPVVRFVNKMLLDAIKTEASDIHFEPYEKVFRIRYRIDGILREVAKPPVNLARRMATRIKVMSEMDISERRMPQDGHIKMRLSTKRAIDFRVNTLPTMWGEKIVLRILDPSSAKMNIDQLGYTDEQKKLFIEELNKPQGMIIVTGPTGSGKTVSLYTGINILNTSERNISAVEDPVEINLQGINQVNVNYKVGLNFSTALRAFLRQDPDVVMVGEMRDLETAEIAIKAAQTGHLVLSTLHTNSAAETLTRLRHMGIPTYNIATSVHLIIAQRLVRRLCDHCKQPITLPKETLLEEGFSQEQIDSLVVYRPVGCSHCKQGYKGRIGIYEVVRITPAISRIILRNGSSLELAEQAYREGFNDLRTSGLGKVMEGITSLDEINRVTKD